MAENETDDEGNRSRNCQQNHESRMQGSATGIQRIAPPRGPRAEEEDNGEDDLEHGTFVGPERQKISASTGVSFLL